MKRGDRKQRKEIEVKNAKRNGEFEDTESGGRILFFLVTFCIGEHERISQEEIVAQECEASATTGFSKNDSWWKFCTGCVSSSLVNRGCVSSSIVECGTSRK